MKSKRVHSTRITGNLRQQPLPSMHDVSLVCEVSFWAPRTVSSCDHPPRCNVHTVEVAVPHRPHSTAVGPIATAQVLCAPACPDSKCCYSARDFLQAGYSSNTAIRLMTTPAATIAVSGSMSFIPVLGVMAVKQFGNRNDWFECDVPRGNVVTTTPTSSERSRMYIRAVYCHDDRYGIQRRR